MKLRMCKQAITALKMAIAVRPVLYRAHCNLGVTYLNEGRTDQAIEVLTRAVRIQDWYPEAHTALAYAYQKKGMFDEAKREREKARTLKEAAGRE